MTSCASPGSILTNALMTASSLNSCACATCTNPATRRSMHHAATRDRCDFITLLSRRTIGRPDAPARIRPLFASSAIAVAVTPAVAVVALDVHELLDATAVDRLAGVDVPLRVDRIAVQERE